MQHTADVYTVGGNGILRGHFPFGMQAPATTARLRQVIAATTVAAPSHAAGGSPATAPPFPSPASTQSVTSPTTLDVAVVSSSIWAGASTPVILTLRGGGAPLDHRALRVTVRAQNALGARVDDAAGRPFVLVVDSTRFRVSPPCGRAIIVARNLLDRWRDVGFNRLLPYRYAVVSDTPVLDGSLDNPTLNDPAAARSSPTATGSSLRCTRASPAVPTSS